MQARLEAALARLVPTDSTATIDPVIKQELGQLVQEMEQLLQQYDPPPLA